VNKREKEKGKREEQRSKVSKIFIYAFMPLCIFLLLIAFHLSSLTANAAETVLSAGVSINKIPKEFYGTWRVSSKLIDTNNEEIFKKKNVDLWNLFRVDNVITLDNPFSGAHASIMVDEVEGNFIKFKKIGGSNSKKLTDTVEMTLGKETFKGINKLKIDTISEVDGHILKTEWATYNLEGEKISGDSIK